MKQYDEGFESYIRKATCQEQQRKMLFFYFLVLVELITCYKSSPAKQNCNNGETCVFKLETLTLENESKIERGLVRVQNIGEEKHFCNMYGMELLEDNSSDIVFRARNQTKEGRNPICRPAMTKKTFVQ